jgi:UDPglucose 6-dehydrogenase
VVAYDPVAMNAARRIWGDDPRLSCAASPLAALDGADALVILTEWKEFRSPDFDIIRQRLRQPVIVDGRNLFDPKQVRSHGIEYLAIGRRSEAGPRAPAHLPPAKPVTETSGHDG